MFFEGGADLEKWYVGRILEMERIPGVLSFKKTKTGGRVGWLFRSQSKNIEQRLLQKVAPYLKEVAQNGASKHKAKVNSRTRQPYVRRRV